MKMKNFNNVSINQAKKIVLAYKKQGFTFTRNFGKGQNLSLSGALRTKKGTLRQVQIFTNAPITRCRAISYSLVKNHKVSRNSRAYINGHSWGY